MTEKVSPKNMRAILVAVFSRFRAIRLCASRRRLLIRSCAMMPAASAPIDSAIYSGITLTETFPDPVPPWLRQLVLLRGCGASEPLDQSVAEIQFRMSG